MGHYGDDEQPSALDRRTRSEAVPTAGYYSASGGGSLGVALPTPGEERLRSAPAFLPEETPLAPEKTTLPESLSTRVPPVSASGPAVTSADDPFEPRCRSKDGGGVTASEPAFVPLPSTSSSVPRVAGAPGLGLPETSGTLGMSVRNTFSILTTVTSHQSSLERLHLGQLFFCKTLGKS